MQSRVIFAGLVLNGASAKAAIDFSHPNDRKNNNLSQQIYKNKSEKKNNWLLIKTTEKRNNTNIFN
jgi:hypothetical protein